MAEKTQKTAKTPPKKIKSAATRTVWREYGSWRVWAAVNKVELSLLREVLRGRNRGLKRWTKGYAVRKKLEKQGLLSAIGEEKSA
ncbi:hypothetical protein FACS189487_05590 [Campylobacterota bacterium]|nr:hypothetical protein FACS189487_05590 [Campylobacterota bacterium]